MAETKTGQEAESSAEKISAKGFWRRHVVAVAIAAIAVAATFLAATATGDELITKPEFGGDQPEALGIGLVVGATALFGGVGGAALALGVARFARNPRRSFASISLIGLIVYGFLAFIRAETTETAVWLNVMHLVAAAPIVGAALWSLPRNRFT